MDLYLILVLPAILFSLWAQWQVNAAFGKYSKVRTARGLTGADAAREVLRQNGISNVSIERVAGNLTDHYDPRGNVIRLSESVYASDSVSAAGVAAHEAGHAVQYAKGYNPVKIRSSILPVTQIASSLSMPLILVGLLVDIFQVIQIGIVLFLAAVIFQLVTLPVEFNASSRAIAALGDTGVLSQEELPGVQKVLSAAAMTYVAALAVSMAQFIRLLLLFGGRDRRRR